jgi:hypothetical protein
MTLCPADEAPRDPSLAEYRDRLRDAVERKSESALLPLIDENIRTSFGDDGGIAAFRRMWNPSDPRSPLWRELATILELGGSFKGETFWAPYVYSNWPDDVDAFEYVALTSGAVPLRAAADSRSDVIATLDWKIVRLLDKAGRVRTIDGREGWIDPGAWRSPIGYRAAFSRSGGVWKMTALVAGD